jgi:phenylalanyl-tRNA synthetase beta chain
VGRLTPKQRLRRKAEDALIAQGLDEIVGWSFAGPEISDKLLLSSASPAALSNPMSSEQSQLRTTLIGSLLDVAQRNRARGVAALGMFESGAIYHAGQITAETLVDEPHHLAVLLAGSVRPATWREPRPPQADFFAAKGILTGLFSALGIDWEVRPGTTPFLHPGRAASVYASGEEIGWLGEIHPNVAAHWDFEDTVAGLEVSLSAIEPPTAVQFRDLVSFPAVHEDLAIVVDEQVATSELFRVAREAGSPLVQNVAVFDVYRDEQRLGAGKKSVALRLSYRAADRTLTDDEVARQRQFIVNALAHELDGTIRAGE